MWKLKKIVVEINLKVQHMYHDFFKVIKGKYLHYSI